MYQHNTWLATRLLNLDLYVHYQSSGEGMIKKHRSASDITSPAFLRDCFWLHPVFNLFSFYGTARELLEHTSLLATLFIMILSGRSMVLAMARMISLECFWVGQSNKLYITFCFRVHSRSSCRDKEIRIRLEKGMASYLQYLMGVWEQLCHRFLTWFWTSCLCCLSCIHLLIRLHLLN